MKITIFSDSHGDAGTMCGATEKEKPDMIIHLGDGIADTAQLSEKYPDVQMIKMLGNMDSDNEDEEWIKFAEICGRRFVMTHGHTLIKYTFFSVTNEYKLTDEDRTAGRANIINCIGEYNADIFLHGHTHEPFAHKTPTENGTCWILNPGRVGRIRGTTFTPTYSVLKINEAGALEWQFVEVN